jgi:hypothetical protein
VVAGLAVDHRSTTFGITSGNSGDEQLLQVVADEQVLLARLADDVAGQIGSCGGTPRRRGTPGSRASSE